MRLGLPVESTNLSYGNVSYVASAEDLATNGAGNGLLCSLGPEASFALSKVQEHASAFEFVGLARLHATSIAAR